jgi:hypothetical protein
MIRSCSFKIQISASSSSTLPSLSASIRNYWHNIPKDLVPEGMRASRFQSSITPRQRMEAQIELGVLSPAFGGNSAGSQYPLVTLAINDRIDGEAFAEKFRNGLDENLNRVSDIDKVVQEVLATAKGVSDAEHRSQYRKNNRFYDITTGITMFAGTTPWAKKNRELMKRELPAAAIPMFDKINPACLGIEVYFNITTSRTHWRRMRKVNPENWIEPELTNSSNKPGAKSAEENDDEEQKKNSGNNDDKKKEEAQIEIDLEIFSRCQRNILRAVNSRRPEDFSFLLEHNIVCAIPGSVPEGIESIPEKYGGVPISDQKIEQTHKIWKDRIERFS